MKFLVILVLFSLSYADESLSEEGVDHRDLLPFLEFCREKHLNFERCWESSIEDLRKILKKGSEKYSLRSVEEIHLNNQYTEKVVSMVVRISDLILNGLGDYYIKNINLKSSTPEIEIDVSKLKLHGYYNVSGSLLNYPILPINGNGTIHINMTDCTFKSKMTPEIYTVETTRKVKFTKADVKMTIDGGKIRIDDRAKKIQNYIAPLNFLLNQHFVHVTKQLVPLIEETVEFLLLDVGDPDYHIPSIEPLFIDNLMSENLTDMLLNVSSVKAYGCSEYQITNIHMDFDTMDCNFDIDIPVLRIEADYNIDGKLIMIPIKGKGVFDANITNVAAKASLNGDLINKNGANHLHYSTINLKVKVGGGNVKMETYHSDKVFRKNKKHIILS
ncbi:unnamed protein product [Brassicogethes aeneus]|uniref:Uncharacterized protein n=1 Tax=Brassicogethes aeneus TaxID=1431903 RepID=A0A9P0B9U5_BRAAE|nr:unnamed protein product [Brassicogethes aeneus]